MGDDAATVEQLRAELRQARDEIDSLRQREAAHVGELADAREQQSASAEVLRIIATSSTDLPSVLATLTDRAYQVVDAYGASIWEVFGDGIRSHARRTRHGPLPNQPTPTRCPGFQRGTSAPTASITPAISCPGTRGYWIPGQCPSLVKTSL